MNSFNVVDVFIILGLLFYVWVHIKDGFLSLTQRLVSFIGALILAFRFYDPLSAFISARFTAFPGLLDAISFVILFLMFQNIISWAIGKALSYLPPGAFQSAWNRMLAVVPALVDGLISVAVVLFLLVIVPILPEVKRPVEDSLIGGPLVNKVSQLEGYANQIFGRAAQEALSFLTVPAEEGEVIALPFQPRTVAVDEEAEERMLGLLNDERLKLGLPLLLLDETIVSVAREHSFDMWERQYFAHENPEGETPFDRMTDGEVRFRRAGENLALARTVERAHEGLMNSPGHKRNILDPTFGRVGIGVVDGGIYGKMFTQDFAD